MRHGGYDVIHVHEPNAPFVSYFATEFSRVPLVGTFHCYSTSTLANGFASNVVGVRRLYNKLGVRIAVSEAAQWTAERYYGGRYRIVPNGVDLAAARPDHGGDGPLELLFVGRADARKGLPVLLRAFEALRSAGVPARLTVAGATWEEVEPVLMDAEGVHVAGRVSDEEKWRLLGQADLLCAPSLGGESFGMVLTEAFASNTPVVASDIVGYRDVVRHGYDGLLVPPADPAALGEALRDLALDPAAAPGWPRPPASAPSASPGPRGRGGHRGLRGRSRAAPARHPAAGRAPAGWAGRRRRRARGAPAPDPLDRARGAAHRPPPRRPRGAPRRRGRRRRRRRRADRAGHPAHRHRVHRPRHRGRRHPSGCWWRSR